MRTWPVVGVLVWSLGWGLGSPPAQSQPLPGYGPDLSLTVFRWKAR